MSKSLSRRCSSLPAIPVTIVATLDLANPNQRAAHELLHRLCSGRWPTWRLLGVRRAERALIVAVKWRRGREYGPCAMVKVSLEEAALRWRYFPNPAAARKALDRLDLCQTDGQAASMGALSAGLRPR
jgi:hypothetical protein